MIPLPQLIEICDHAFRPWASSHFFQATRPTAKSIRTIQDRLGVTIPPAFVQLAEECRSYGGWFASLGNNFAHSNHIISLNQAFHAENLPPWAVMFNHGHDDDCDCWDTRKAGTLTELPIVYISLDPKPGKPTLLAATFEAYLEQLCRDQAPHIADKTARQRALRILEAYPVSISRDS